ncbi:MAG: flagellar basal body L-ring protein FlgH [Oligoflexia bacterium]|nr:flagellar basal body L-ring protein FlgH [Oligoflexia bacterium]
MRGARGTLLLAVLLIAVTGCAGLTGKLRRDLDDTEPYDAGPTSGGIWQERGFLSESMPEGGRFGERFGRVGHSERNPASGVANLSPGEDSWVSPAQAEANRRERLGHGMAGEEGEAQASYSSQPNHVPESKRFYKNGSRATRADFIDDSANEGSLWASDGQTNYYFTKNKIRGVGDIISIKLEDDMIRDFGQEVKRNLTGVERLRELNAARDRMRAKYAPQAVPSGGNRAPAAAGGASGAPAKEGEAEAPRIVPGMEVPEPSNADIDVAKALEVKAGDTMLAEIIERYANGNYKVRGTKKVAYKNGNPRVVTLLAVARGNDITEEDVITSGKLYEYRLEAYR